MGIVVVATGGTISMRPDPVTGGLVPALSGADLVELIRWPEAPPLELDDFAHVPSWDLHGELAFRLALRVREHARRAGVTGVVVTHGTDTMEESVYMIDRLLDTETPVVLVGAQRANSVPDSDGPRNLRSGILVAATTAARGRGALVCCDGELHAAREVRKVHTSALRAFGSPGYGPIGVVDELTVRFQRSPERRPPGRAPGAPARWYGRPPRPRRSARPAPGRARRRAAGTAAAAGVHGRAGGPYRRDRRSGP